jgi:hypothetical protein
MIDKWSKKVCDPHFCTFLKVNPGEPFFLKIVPFSHFLTESNNPNTHFRKFFMLYTNQIRLTAGSANLFEFFSAPYLTATDRLSF